MRPGVEGVLHTDLYGVMNGCHAAAPGMIELGGGRIVTIVSDAGRVGEARLAAYAAAKAGAAGFVRAVAKEVGRHAITCNARTRDVPGRGGPRAGVPLRRPPPGAAGGRGGDDGVPMLGGGGVDHRPDLSGERRL